MDQKQPDFVREYVPDGRVLTDFVFDNSSVAVINGPVGSGTSSALVGRMRRHMLEQVPNREGIRRSRWVVVRPTYGLLQQTFMKTYSEWMSPGKGSSEILQTPPFRHLILPDQPMAKIGDGTRLDVEVIFLALEADRDSQYYNTMLDSYEFTGIVVNEAQDYKNKLAIDAILGRAEQGRFPPMMDGGPSWFGCLMDLNAPPNDHWLCYMRGDTPYPIEWTDEKKREYTKPDHWKFFRQPAGLIEKFDHSGNVVGYEENPKAENARWRRQPYTRLIAGKSQQWIETKVMNRPGLQRSGDVVFPAFNQTRHVEDKIDAQAGFPLVVGLDTARNPYAVIGQNVRGSWKILGEFFMRSASASTFAPAFRRYLFENFGEFFSVGADDQIQGISFWADPSSNRRDNTSDDSWYTVLEKKGIFAQPAPGNNKIQVRLDAVETCLTRITPNGHIGMEFSKAGCPVLISAMHSGYVLGPDGAPDKSKSGIYADAADALQYMALGGGDGTTAMAGGAQAGKVVGKSNRKYRLPR